MAKIKVERGLNLGTAYTPDMQDGTKRPEPTWSTIRDQVREADALGYDTILAVETQHDPYLELAIAAQEPSKIELATGIALAYTKSPVATAYTAWDLQRMSGGRLNLGLGSQVKGHVTRRFGMPWSKPAQRMKDYVGAMRACWRTWQTREPFNFQSEHYNLSLMTPELRAAAGLESAYPRADCGGAGADAASCGRSLRWRAAAWNRHAEISRSDRVPESEKRIREIGPASR